MKNSSFLSFRIGAPSKASGQGLARCGIARAPEEQVATSSPPPECGVPLGDESCRLILTRRLGEAIRIGEDIVVTVKAVHRQPGWLRIEAPANVPLSREEVTEEGR